MPTFDDVLAIPEEDIEFVLRGISHVPWSDFILNPRRLRGSDFLMRWSQGVWSEHSLIEAVNNTNEFFAVEYGPSGTAPDNDVRAFELYFERLEKAGLGDIKRPDLLIFPIEHKAVVEELIRGLGGKEELPFTPESNLQTLLSHSIVGIECETSLWKTKVMPDYGKPLTPQKRLLGKPGLKKNAVVPDVIVKDQDMAPLALWQDANHVKIHIWHVFYDQAFGLSLDQAQHLITEGLIQPIVFTYQAPGGATTKKTIYKFYYHYAYHLADTTEEPSLKAAYIQDKNGHILPYVTFTGGKLQLSQQALNVLREMSR